MAIFLLPFQQATRVLSDSIISASRKDRTLNTLNSHHKSEPAHAHRFHVLLQQKLKNKISRQPPASSLLTTDIGPTLKGLGHSNTIGDRILSTFHHQYPYQFREKLIMPPSQELNN